MSTRTLFAAGYIPPKHVKATGLARRCAWCGLWMSEHDLDLHLAGAETTHGCCSTCEAIVNAEIDAMPEPPEAA